MRTIINTVNAVISPDLSFSQVKKREEGMRATMPAKIRRLMPLPIPRSVICSPSHMMKIEPVVKERTVRRRKLQGSCIVIRVPD